MSTATKALILTWVAIGFLVVGAVGFYLGRLTTPKERNRLPQQQGLPQQQQGSPQPSPVQSGGQQPGNQQQPMPGGGGFQPQPTGQSPVQR